MLIRIGAGSTYEKKQSYRVLSKIFEKIVLFDFVQFPLGCSDEGYHHKSDKNDMLNLKYRQFLIKLQHLARTLSVHTRHTSVTCHVHEMFMLCSVLA